MRQANASFVCHGCGTAVDAALALPFRCPNAGADDVDHLLLPADSPVVWPEGQPGEGDNPFLRYRALLSPYRLARSAGLSEDAWAELLGRLDEKLADIEGTGFHITPFGEQRELARAAGIGGHLWVKDETGNVGGSHKARHLMGVMLYLRVIAAARLAVADNLRRRPLAIASCGNAALAAAVIARAADWPLEVFIPPDAATAVVGRLRELGARITVCRRQSGEAGDPCLLRFRAAVQSGAIPFGVQGTENGLAIEAGRTLAFELAEAFAARSAALDAIYVQVGGGALASAVAQGFALAVAAGRLPRLPVFMAVQGEACAPLARAWQRVGESPLAEAAQHRSRCMWPWESPAHSVAHGILDDETYDWLEIVKAMRESGGKPVLADEAALISAHGLGQRTGIRVSATGTAGLAGLLGEKAPPVNGTGNVAVIFSGAER